MFDIRVPGFIICFEFLYKRLTFIFRSDFYGGGENPPE